MRYKTLGKTGLNVSVATVGTWAIGGSGWGAVDRQDSIAAIRSMLDNDVNIVDTARFTAAAIRRRSSARRSRATTAKS